MRFRRGFISVSGWNDPDEVRALHERMTRDGVETTALEQLPDFVVFRCRDPDGYQIEVYWE